MKEKKQKNKISSEALKKQHLRDFEHLLDMDLGKYLILNEEGSINQIEEARQRVRSDLLKYGAEMQKLASEIGGTLPETVQAFLKVIEHVIHASGQWLDQATVNEYLKIAENLENKLGRYKKAV